MKEGIHPKYYEIEARCACGATWKTRSTKPELHLEICNNCHPFFTGRQKLVDTEGRVERFTKRFGVQTSESRKAAAKTTRKAARRESIDTGTDKRYVRRGTAGRFKESDESAMCCSSSKMKCGTRNVPSRNLVSQRSATRPSMMTLVSSTFGHTVFPSNSKSFC